MSNPLYQALNNNPYSQLIAEAKQLRQNLTTNPREEVQKMLNSGQISQEQFNQAKSFAEKLMTANPNAFV